MDRRKFDSEILEIITIELVTEDDGKRLDVVIAEKIDDISRSYASKLILKNLITVNDIFLKSSYRVKKNDIIKFYMPELEPLDVNPENIPLDIVYEDDQIIVINKSMGIITHPMHGNTEGTLVNALLYHCKELSGIGGVMRPGIVHRLDKDTSGLIVVAKNDRAHWSLTDQFKNRIVKKTYNAIIKGQINEKEGIIEKNIARNPKNRVKMITVESGGKYAYTSFRVLEEFEKAAFLEINILTGRTHQIRVHMTFLKHPIAGDHLYSRGKSWLDKFGLALCAKKLEFDHPISGERLEFEVDLPEHMEILLSKLREKGTFSRI